MPSPTRNIVRALIPQAQQPVQVSGLRHDTVEMKFAYYDTSTKKIIHGQEKVAQKMTLPAKSYNAERKGTSPQGGELERVTGSLKRNFNQETFIRGHLLNEKLGGLGVAKNLFPITHQANVDHSNKVEYPIKDFLHEYDGHTLSGEYDVEIHYHGGGIIDNNVDTMNHDFDIVCTCDFEAKDESGRLENKISNPQRIVIRSKAVGENVFYDIANLDASREEDVTRSGAPHRYTNDLIKPADFMRHKLESIQQVDNLLTNNLSIFSSLEQAEIDKLKKAIAVLMEIKNKHFGNISGVSPLPVSNSSLGGQDNSKFSLENPIQKKPAKKRPRK